MALGAAAACGFQPLALWPLTVLCVAGLMFLIGRADSWKRAAVLGWCFGLGHFTVGDNWIATSFTYQANMPAWLGWLAVVLLSVYLAVYPALATLGAWLARRYVRADIGLAFAACWIVSEWLRGWVFTGFAWNPLGMALLGGFSGQGLAKLAPWLGTYALSGLVVLIADVVRRGAEYVSGRPWQWRNGILAVLFAACIALPMYSLKPAQVDAGTVPFTLVQPDTRQEDLDDPWKWHGQFLNLAGLSQAEPGKERLVLWPESGVQDYLREGYPLEFYEGAGIAADPLTARQRIGEAIGAGGLLLTGAVDLDVNDGEVIGARNVVTAIDHTGAIRGSYAKAHLVPYGEYLALRWLLEPLGASRLVPGALDFIPGPGPRTLDLGALGKAGIQICYEIVFSGEVVDRQDRPDYIFNPSNDGWFGTWGPPQHLAQARMRAIEEGLPVLRATTTGISAVIDANGIVRQHVPRHQAGRIDGLIPQANAPTLFARWGNRLPLAWAAMLFVLSMVATRRSRG